MALRVHLAVVLLLVCSCGDPHHRELRRLCRDHEGEELCHGRALVVCDDRGKLVEEQPCSDGEACVVPGGCMSCTLDLVPSYRSTEAPVSLIPSDHPLDRQPIVLRSEPGVGGVILDAPGELPSVTLADGTPVELPHTFPAHDLPATVYAAAHLRGSGELVATLDAERLGCEPLEQRVDFETIDLPGLAGRALDRHPWFTVVETFEVSDSISVSVDPSRFPDRLGAAADAYLVDHRDDWQAGDVLADVTGQVERLTVRGGSLALGITSLWPDPDPGDGVGAAYDLVLDFGLDGTVDPGDLVDGLGSEAGLWVVGDLAAPGPHAVSAALYSGGAWLGQKAYWPTDIAALDPVPLVVISHGNGHDHTWYDYLGEHLASWGYAVMSHQNNTGPGIETASTTTLENTDWFLGHLDTLAGGALSGRVDGHRMAWIGHSRGGEGVVRAVDRLVDEGWTPDHFGVEDLAVVSSIAPTVYYPVDTSDPHHVPYHLLAGAADGDVTGGPDCPPCQYFRLVAAAEGVAQSTYVHGASHNDFNCCGFYDTTGPDPIGRSEAQVLAKAYYLALVEWYLRGNEATAEYFTRMYDDLHPGSIDPGVVVATTFHDPGATALDDFQSQPDPGTSSTGQVVDWQVSAVVEGKLDDGNWSLTHRETDPMNGMTWAHDGEDLARGVVIEWASGEQGRVTWTVGEGDLRQYSWLSFRACQGTRHPNTVALDEPLTFTVTLVDGSGATSSLDLGALGAIPSPYPRWGLGMGTGWVNEFATVRLRLTDFTADGVDLDLGDIAEVRFELGGEAGSPTGRLGVDDLELIP